MIPWRVVWKDSTTTPVRPVLDASTNSPRRVDGSGGSNLNNAVCHGKVDSLDLLGVLLRFIFNKHAVAADITKMYNMFRLLPEYWNLQRVCMKKDLDPNSEVIDGVITITDLIVFLDNAMIYHASRAENFLTLFVQH